MRISSNYRDYYDHLQAYTYGQSKIYDRNWVKMEFISEDYSNPYFHHTSTQPLCGKFKHNGQRIIEQQIIVGFCGTIYSYMKYEKWSTFCWDIKKREYPPEELEFLKFLYSVDDYLSLYKKNYQKKEQRRIYSKYFFSKKDDNLFIKNNCPIFVITDSEKICCSLNPNKNRVKSDLTLKSLEFQELVPDTTAWTDLTSYIDFLGTQFKEIPEIENETKIENHGFSAKNSFRKHANN